MRKEGKGPNRRGSVYQDKTGQWWAQLPPDDLGRRPKRRAQSEADAVLKLGELESGRAGGLDFSSNPTVAQFLTTWLIVSVQPNVSPRTFEDRAYLCEHYIAPHIGPIRLRKLTVPRAQQLFNTLQAAGLAIDTVKTIRRRLIAALNVAIEWHLITENVAKKTKIPAAGASAMRTLTLEQAQQLLDILAPHRLSALYQIALALGPRQGELVGLRWLDVDFVRREIHIRSQVRRHKKMINRKAPKMERSRVIPLDDTLLAALDAHRRNQEEEQRITGDWENHGLVFPSERGTPLFGSSLSRQLKIALQNARLPHIRFHDLRHTSASLMLAAGIPLADVSAILGHANAGITARLYAHSYEGGRRNAVETMGRLLQRGAK